MRGRSGLRWRARAFLALVCLAGGVIVGWAALHIHAHSHGWATFAILAAGAALTQLFPVITPRHAAFTVSLVFTLPGIFLLPLPLVALLPIVQLLPEWLRERYAWYMVAFNAGNWIVDLYAGWMVAHAVQRWVSGDAGKAGAAAAAIVTVSVLNHLVLALMITLARGESLPSTGLLTFDSLANEAMLGAVGIVVATFWTAKPWFVPLALAPLLLVRRSLAVESLKEEARIDPKTGLFNARHFAAALSEEMARAERFDRPLSLIMADLDLLRDVNNNYGHLAGDAVLEGIASVFREELRHYDIPARFGGEEFSILLPETPIEQALEIAERIRQAIANRTFDVDTSDRPIGVTISLGVATFPRDGGDANELIHQADLAVYRAKLQGRNRVLAASAEVLLLPADRKPAPAIIQEENTETSLVAPILDAAAGDTRPHVTRGPRFLTLSLRMASLIAAVALLGIAGGVAGVMFGVSRDWLALIAILAVVALGQALAIENVEGGSISISAVGALAGVALVGPRVALPLAVTIAAVEWSARRPTVPELAFNIGVLSLSSLTAALVFAAVPDLSGNAHRLAYVIVGPLAGVAYFIVDMGLVSLAVAVEGHERWVHVFRERYGWLLLHYVGYGFVGAAMTLAYELVGIIGIVVFAVPLLLQRKTQQAYLRHTERSARKLRRAAETIQSQNVSLEQANRLLRERSTAAMESLSATVDARDAYTAGHSRRVQQLALAIGRELGLSEAELSLLGHAALFHDIGKLAVPDAILLKPASLTDEEWLQMQRHAEEGARIIDRLGFLQDAVPAIKHHHERWDGSGYPDRLEGEEIPLGARIIHVADALDSMLTTRIYRAARPTDEALGELRRLAGRQFCPRCVAALDRVVASESLPMVGSEPPTPSDELVGATVS